MSGFAYFEWSVEGEIDEVDLDDRRLWRQANPSLGVVRSNGTGLSEDYVAGVERGSMTDEEFARERLGIFDDQDDIDDEETVIPPEDWADCRDPHDPRCARRSWMVDPVCFAIDLPPERSSTSICAAGGRASDPDGLVCGEVVDHRPGTSWVVDRMVQLRDNWKPKLIVLDPASAAGGLLTDLLAAGLDIRLVTSREHAQACGSFFDAVADRRFRHLGQPELDAAVEGARQRLVGDAWLWSRRDSNTNISPIVGVTLACWAHNQPTVGVPQIY